MAELHALDDDGGCLDCGRIGAVRRYAVHGSVIGHGSDILDHPYRTTGVVVTEHRHLFRLAEAPKLNARAWLYRFRCDCGKRKVRGYYHFWAGTDITETSYGK